MRLPCLVKLMPDFVTLFFSVTPNSIIELEINVLTVSVSYERKKHYFYECTFTIAASTKATHLCILRVSVREVHTVYACSCLCDGVSTRTGGGVVCRMGVGGRLVIRAPNEEGNRDTVV